VDFRVCLQELVELGVCVGPGQFRSKGARWDYFVIEERPAWLPIELLCTVGMPVLLSFRVFFGICVQLVVVLRWAIPVALLLVCTCGIDVAPSPVALG